jgi:hypothetical protein
LPNTFQVKVSALLGVGLLASSFAGQTLAVTSGQVHVGYVQTVPPPPFLPVTAKICMESIVQPYWANPAQMDFKGWIFSYDETNKLCNPPGTGMQAGGFGLKLEGWKDEDGEYCGTTEWFYNTGSLGGYGLGVLGLCANPEGTQAFRTLTYGRAWHGAINNYVNFGPINSPNANGLVEGFGLAEVEPVPTMGGVPDSAFTAEGLNPSLVPDLVAASTREGARAGYIRKEHFLADGGRARLNEPLPVFDAQGDQLVGHMYPGRGFVPLGQSPTSIKPFEVRIHQRSSE